MASEDSSTPNARQSEGIYNALVSVRNTELSVYYTRYNIQAVINFGLIAAVLAIREDSLLLSPLLPWIIIGGAALSLIWLGFAVVGKRLFTDRWEDYIRRYERDVLAPQGLQPDLQMFTHVAGEEQRLNCWKRNWNNLNVLTRLVPIIAFAAWVLIAGLSWYMEPLEGRLSRLEAGIAKLQELPGSSKEINRRLDSIERDISGILQRSPGSGTASPRKAKPVPTLKPEQAR